MRAPAPAAGKEEDAEIAASARGVAVFFFRGGRGLPVSITLWQTNNVSCCVLAAFPQAKLKMRRIMRQQELEDANSDSDEEEVHTCNVCGGSFHSHTCACGRPYSVN